MTSAVADRPDDPGIAVVAFGGNTLVRRDEEGHLVQQMRNAERGVAPILHLVRRGYRVAIVHGNGPQVGHELIRHEEATTKVPAMPLDVCVASTQGTMGYLIELALRHQAMRRGIDLDVCVTTSLVVVAHDDPAFAHPSKPIGPFYSRFRAEQVRREYGRKVVEDAGRGWRMVVPSPRPVEILGVEAVRMLLHAGWVVVTGGGGGVPVTRDRRGRLRGVEAVIDKDHTAALLARRVGARLLVVLTGVSRVSLHYNTPQQQPLGTIAASELRAHLEAGHFPPGSMGPKIEAVLSFLAGGGQQAIVTSAERLGAALHGKDGTRVFPDDALRDGPPGPDQLELAL